jgi:hypothetical protein
MEAIANRGEVAEKRQTIQESLRRRRQKLLSRATVGSDKGIQEKYQSHWITTTLQQRFGNWYA